MSLSHSVSAALGWRHPDGLYPGPDRIEHPIDGRPILGELIRPHEACSSSGESPFGSGTMAGTDAIAKAEECQTAGLSTVGGAV